MRLLQEFKTRNAKQILAKKIGMENVDFDYTIIASNLSQQASLTDGRAAGVKASACPNSFTHYDI